MRRGNAWAAWAGKGTGKAAAAVAIVVLMLIMGLAPLVSSGDGSAPSAVPSTGHAILKMQEQGLVIDTGAGYDIPKEWQNAGTELRLVQFTGSAQGNWPAGVENTAGKILHSIGDTAVVVRANARQESELRALDYVQWVGPYEPRFKVFANLLDMTGDIQITAFASPDVETARMIRELKNLGAWDVEDTHFGAVNCRIQSGKLPYVARLDSVLLIQHLPEMKTLCSASGRVVDAHDLWVNTVSNLPQNIMGQGQIVHVQDTGIDATHRDFTSGPLGNRIGYAESTTDAYYHGTFMTGVIAGNGYNMETYLGLSTTDRVYNALAATNPAGYPDRMGFAGRAPEATIYSRAGLTSAEWYNGYTYGARIFSNSWGPALLGPYYSAGADAFMLANPGALVLFAAGGGGPRTQTVSGEGNGKLVVSVGACENIRPLKSQDSDNPNQILVFSARGPVDDGRVKPDVVEVGGNIYSALSDDSTAENQGNELYDLVSPINSDSSDSLGEYLMLSGTSVAVAAASGDTALIRDYLVDVKGIASPHANLMKTLLIHGAEDLGYGYPSFDQGWGRVNVRNSICPPAPNVLQWYHHATGIASGTWDARTDGSLTTWVTDESVPLKVTMSHWDASGSGVLTYDLDLKVTSPNGQVYWGNAFKDAWSTPLETQSDWSECAFPSWMGGAAYDWDTADDGGDDINNVEMFRVEKPEKGQWTVQVVWKSSTARSFTVAMTGGFNASADVNAATNQYKVSMEMERPRVVPERDDFGEAVFTCAPGGSVIIPYMINNGGTSNDAYTLAATLPSGFTLLSYMPASPPSATAGERIRGYATIAVGPAVVAGTYTLAIKSTSVNDASAPIAQSQIKFQIDVQTAETPPAVKITDSPMHEDAPSMVSWNSGGNDYIACAYRKEEQFSQRVYFTLSSDGGRTWSEGIPVNPRSWSPDFVSITRANSGPYEGRLMISYNAWNPDGYAGSVSDTRCAYVKVAYADYPYTAWTEKNAFSLGEGVSTGNTYRTVNVNWVPSVSQFYLTVEDFGYDFSDLNTATQNAIACIGKSSNDGGATWSTWARIDPNVAGLYYFFPSTDIDALGNMFLFYYERDSGDAAQDRDLTYQYYTGTWSTMRLVWDTTDNLMFPAACAAPQGVNSNRAYAAMLKGANTDGDRSLYLAWTDNPNGNPPTWVTNKGPYGPVLSDQDYGTRFLVDGEYTYDGYVWWTAIRHLKYDPYAQPNIFTVRDNDYATAPTPTIDYITLNSYQKSKQRTTDITEGGGKLVAAWNQMTRDADTDIYCAQMSNGWQSEADTLGPVVEDIAVDRTECAAGTLLNLAANINDWPTGGSDILDAQYSVNYGATTVQMWESDGGFDTPAEAAYAPSQIDTAGWTGGWHSIWVRGQDNQGNWGEWSEVMVLITGAAAPNPPTDPDPADGATEVPLSQVFSVYYSDSEDEPGTVRFYWKDNPTPFATTVAGSGTRAVTTGIALASQTSYEWYVTAQDSVGTARGPTVGYWSFSTVDETPPAPPTGLNVYYDGPDIQTFTETRYMRGVADETIVNGLTSYSFGTANSATLGNWAAGNSVQIYLGMRVWKRSSADVETEITSGTVVATVSRTVLGSGFQTASWNCPQTVLNPSDSIVVRIYGDTTANPTTLRATFTTLQLGATQLESNLWSVQYWTRYGTIAQGGSDWYWGNSAYDNHVSGFKWGVAGNPTDHNTLEWAKSSDDGAGANDVMGYKIYRADNPEGPWTVPIDFVPAGTISYVDLFKGQADATNWWYVVRANDTSGNEEMNTNAVPEILPGPPYNIDLTGRAAGTWAFLSFPIEASSVGIESILGDAIWGDGQTDWDVAKAWDNVNKRWLSYRKGGTANTLSHLDNTMGFWLHLTANGGDQMLSLCPGDMPSGPVDIPLYAGWNMVGYPSLVGRTVGVALWGTTADHVDVFTTVSPYITPANSNYVMTPDCGYWVRVTSDSVWRIEDVPTTAPYLEVTKTAPATASPGEDIVYTITCTNIGDATAYDIVITETYPVGTTYVSSVPLPTMPNNVWMIGTLAPSQNYVITITMAVDTGATGILVNQVEAQYEDGNGDPMPPVSDIASTVIIDPLMLFTKTGPITANPGEVNTYTLTCQNIGTDWAYNVVVTEIYPPGVSFAAAVPAPSMGDNTWFLGDIAPGATFTITVTVMFQMGTEGNATNSAYLDYENGAGDSRRVWANWTTLVGNPDMELLNGAYSSISAGSPMNYTLVYTNNGIETAYGLELTDTYPAGVTFVSSSPVPSIGNNVWQFASVPPGGSGNVRITVLVDVNATGTLVNSASLFYMNGVMHPFTVWANDSTLVTPSRPVHNIDSDEYFFGIQAAIDDVDTLDGHTITVEAGNYTGGIYLTKSVRLLGESNLTTFIEPNWGEGLVISADNVTLSGFSILNAEFAIYSVTNNSVFEYNNISYTRFSFMVGQALHCEGSGNLIAHNEFFMNDIDILVSGANIVRDNILKRTWNTGISLFGTGTQVYHNWVLETQISCAEDRGSGNSWDSGYPGGGNYWCQYTGGDIFSGPGQDQPGSDGIGDTPFAIGGAAGAQDNYPLMLYWVPFGNSVHNLNTDEYFDTIQAAIDDTDTLNGHTITVAAGTYYEHVTVTKSINLFGESRWNTVIDANGTGDCITITTSYVTVSGFTVQNAGDYIGSFDKDAGIELRNVQGCTVQDSRVVNNELIGVWIYKYLTGTCTNNTVFDNDCSYNQYGIYSELATANHIIGNEFYNNSRGLYQSGSSHDVSGNIFSGNGFGILYSGAGNNILTENRFSGNYYGLYISSGTGNQIYHNDFIDNNISAQDDAANVWDAGYPSAGNYWSDYSGADTFSGIGQDIPGSDSIGDTPYIIDADSRDGYPLMSNWLTTGRVQNLDTGEYFDTIQAAIDDADTLNSHTIAALAGTYFENIIIYKSLKINGVGADGSIIIGNMNTGPGVTILSDGSTFSNFTVMNCDLSPSQIGISVRANNVTVIDNIIRQNSKGLTVGNTGTFMALLDSTGDFDSGSKSVFNENYAVESVSDNAFLPDGCLSLASFYGDSFNCPSSDAGTWKWLNADDKLWGNGVHSAQTKNINVTQSGKGYMALNSVTAQDDLGLMGPAMIDSANDWDIQLDFNKVYSENNNQWLFGFYFLKNWNGSGVMAGDNFRLIYYAYDGGMRFYADMTVGGINQGSNYIGTTATSGALRVRYDTDVNTLYFYYWNSNVWAQLWSKTYNIDSWDLRFMVPLASYVTLPDIRMSFDNFRFSGSFASAPYMPSGNWTSEDLPMSQAYLMTNCTVTYTNATPQNYVDRIEWIVNGSVVAIYDQDIIGGNVLDIRDSDLTAGSFSSINAFYQIKLYFVGNGYGSIVIDSILHSAYQVSNYWGNVIARNDVMNNGIGIEVISSGSGIIYANRFIDNAIQAEDLYGDCSWDAGYPDGGNTWSDYFGADLYSGPGQNIPGSDGIGDTPYFLDGSQDSYPLMEAAGAAPYVVVSKITSTVSVMPRQFVNYTIFFNNTGTAWANQIWLNDTLPAGVTFVQASIPPAYINGQDIRWLFENVPMGNHSLTVMVQVNVGVPKTTVLSNLAVCEYSPNGATTADWANSTVNWMLPPYVIYGYVQDNFGLPLVGTSVNILNNDTGESIVVLTDALGQYSAEMENLPSGYMNGDTLILTTADPSGGFNTTVINTLLFGEQVDITVTVTDITAPTHSGESPSNGGTSANATPVISVDVTDLQAGVNVTTIRLYVMGFNVLCDIEAIENGYRISYWHESGFASGTVVSCRIVARDFAGNLLDYTWSFTVP